MGFKVYRVYKGFGYQVSGWGASSGLGYGVWGLCFRARVFGSEGSKDLGHAGNTLQNHFRFSGAKKKWFFSCRAPEDPKILNSYTDPRLSWTRS